MYFVRQRKVPRWTVEDEEEIEAAKSTEPKNWISKVEK